LNLDSSLASPKLSFFFGSSEGDDLSLDESAFFGEDLDHQDFFFLSEDSGLSFLLDLSPFKEA
jgi:hypothetical protein